MTSLAKKILLLVACLVAVSAHAARIQDIEVLEVVSEDPAEFQFKVRSKRAHADLFFFLGFDKSNRACLDKMTVLLLKMAKPKDHKIDLEIPSFSPYPAGSYYSCTDVQFSQRSLRAPNQVPKANKKK